MRPLLIEGGIYFLLFFAPLAFGGVELWAQGVIQVVTGLVAAAWAAGRIDGGAKGGQGLSRGARLALALPVVLFVGLVLLQLTPLPPSLLARLSPAAGKLYDASIPGYAAGNPFVLRELPAWLLEKQKARLPGAASQPLSEAEAAGVIPTVLPPAEAGVSFPARRTLTLSPPETRVRLTLLLCCAALFVVSASYFRTKERLVRLLTAAGLSAGLVSIFGIIQRLTWNGRLYWIREGTYHNPFGPFVNRNSYAAFAGTILPIAICLAFLALREWEKGRREALPRVILWALAATSMGVGIALCLSRGGLIAAGISLGLVAALLFYYGRRRSEMMLLGGVVVGTLLLLIWIGPEMVIERVGTLSEGQSIPSFAQRMKAWSRTQGMIADYPWLGAGFGAFRFSFLRYAPPGEGWWTTAHNEYLEVLCDTGWVGALLVAAGLLAWFAQVLRPARFKGRGERYAWTGLAAGIAGLLIHSAISSNLQVPANGVLLALLAGAMLSLTVRHGSPTQGQR